MLRLRIGIAQDSVDAFKHNYDKQMVSLTLDPPPSHVIRQFVHPRIHIEIALSQPQCDGVKKTFDVQKKVGQIRTDVQQ